MRFHSDVSVIVPFFNAEPYIERCIQGLLGQRFAADRFEILMVDNNSTDAGAEIVARHPSVALLREGKQGAYAARNRALREARGRVLVFTDPDCVPHPDWLSQLLAPFDDPATQVVIGRSDPVSDSKALALLSAYDHHKDLFIFGSSDARLFYGRTNNLAARRTAFDACGPFVEVLRGADTIFVRKVADTFGSGSVRYVPEAQVSHLEIDTLGAYFRKLPLYGRSGVGFREIVDRRGLTNRERLEVLKQAIHSGDVPRSGALPLLALLVSGVASARWGAATAPGARRQPV